MTLDTLGNWNWKCWEWKGMPRPEPWWDLEPLVET